MKKILFVFSMIALFILINNSVSAVAPLPSPVCNIEGIIQSVEFKEAYDHPCLTSPLGCPTDTPVNFPARYSLKIKINAVSYAWGETKYKTCEAILPLNTEETIFINKNDVKTGDSFKAGQKIKGLVSSGFWFGFISYELNQSSIAPTIAIVKPTEGDSLVAGSQYTIQWQTQGDTSKLKEYVIYFYNILTKKYDPVISVPINQTSYSWTVPSAIGNNHYLYVGGKTNENKTYWSAVRKFNIIKSTSTHKECNTSKQCVLVDGGGSDLCSTNNDCIVINPMLPFSCNSSTWQCYADPAGKYYSYSVCQDNCKATTNVYNFDISPATSSKTVLINKYALHKFKIQNLGSTNDKYSINVNNINNAEKIIVYPNKSISLNAKASKYIYLWVADKDPGNYKVDISVSSIGNKVIKKTVTTDTIIQSKIQSCIKEGGKIYAKPDTTGYTTKCCDGLIASYSFKTDDSKTCGINPGGAGDCIKCGDGVCSKYENICNCPQDCKSTSNQSPVIDGVTGPTQLKINESGTWTIKAHDPENGYLGYSVKWGDEVSGAGLQTVAPAAKQTTTFTHTYSKAGTYTVEFTVTDDKNQTAKSTMSVKVGDSSINCAKEGESYSSVFKNQYPEHCCAGLTEWMSGMDSKIVQGEKCVETGLLKGSPIGTCIKCGDGICGKYEDICNCPQDCVKKQDTCKVKNDCMWCGQTCVKNDPKLNCIQVMPPQGSACACIEGKCATINSAVQGGNTSRIDEGNLINHFPSPIKMTLGPLQWLTASLVEIF